jgi:hypothetical protein
LARRKRHVEVPNRSHPFERDPVPPSTPGARHVSATEFGRALDHRSVVDQAATLDLLDVDLATLETAVLTLVLASAMTALDLCVGAVAVDRANRH